MRVVWHLDFFVMKMSTVMGWTWVLPFQTNDMSAKSMWMSSVEAAQSNETDRTKKSLCFTLLRAQNTIDNELGTQFGPVELRWVESACIAIVVANEPIKNSDFDDPYTFEPNCSALSLSRSRSLARSFFLLCLQKHLCRRGRERLRTRVGARRRTSERTNKRKNTTEWEPFFAVT